MATPLRERTGEQHQLAAEADRTHPRHPRRGRPASQRRQLRQGQPTARTDPRPDGNDPAHRRATRVSSTTTTGGFGPRSSRPTGCSKRWNSSSRRTRPAPRATCPSPTTLRARRHRLGRRAGEVSPTHDRPVHDRRPRRLGQELRQDARPARRAVPRELRLAGFVNAQVHANDKYYSIERCAGQGRRRPWRPATIRPPAKQFEELGLWQLIINDVPSLEQRSDPAPVQEILAAIGPYAKVLARTEGALPRRFLPPAVRLDPGRTRPQLPAAARATVVQGSLLANQKKLDDPRAAFDQGALAVAQGVSTSTRA